MKKLFTLLTVLLVTTTFAQQRLIAVKGVASGTDAIAKTLTEAIDLAKPGDKIYLPGGFFEHAPAIEKEVHIIGTGFQDGLNVMGRTTINGSLTFGGGANNSTFEGLYITEWFSQVGSLVSDNITVKRCNMKGTYPVELSSYKNSSFINCVVRETLHLGWTNAYNASTMGQSNDIKNCIISKWVYRTNSSTIENCLLAGLNECSSSFIKRNIFYRNDGENDAFRSSAELVLAHNLFDVIKYATYNNGSTISQESGTKNYASIEDVFVKVSSSMRLFNFDTTFDYNIKSSVNAIGVGIYGGSNPWKDGSLPIIPNIEKNSSYLDVAAGKFKLNVKVVPQTH